MPHSPLKRYSGLLLTGLLFPWALVGTAEPPGGYASATRELKVAFFVGQGTSYSVIEMIRHEKPDASFAMDDFDYHANPDGRGAMLDGILGQDFPIFGLVGNHAVAQWPKYQEKLGQRLGRT